MIAYSTEVNRALSPLLFCSKVPVNKMATMAGIKVVHGLSNMGFHSPKQIWLQPLSTQPDNTENKTQLKILRILFLSTQKYKETNISRYLVYTQGGSLYS